MLKRCGRICFLYPTALGFGICIQAESQRPLWRGFGEQETDRTFFRTDCSDSLLRDGAKDSSWILYKASCRSRRVAEGSASALLVSHSRIANTFTSLKANKDLRKQDLKALSLHTFPCNESAHTLVRNSHQLALGCDFSILTVSWLDDCQHPGYSAWPVLTLVSLLRDDTGLLSSWHVWLGNSSTAGSHGGATACTEKWMNSWGKLAITPWCLPYVSASELSPSDTWPACCIRNKWLSQCSSQPSQHMHRHQLSEEPCLDPIQSSSGHNNIRFVQLPKSWIFFLPDISVY